MEMKNDWRLFNQDLYLNNAVLQKKIFAPHSTENDHTHCEFCWKKFCDSTTDLHEGYTTKDEKYWICDICYNDFKDMFHWSLYDESGLLK